MVSAGWGSLCRAGGTSWLSSSASTALSMLGSRAAPTYIDIMMIALVYKASI